MFEDAVQLGHVELFLWIGDAFRHVTTVDGRDEVERLPVFALQVLV